MDISFCIPTCNRINELKRAVESVLKQQILAQIDYELLISDDSNDDATSKYVFSLSSNNAHVKYFKNENRGQFSNLNNLICNAKYDWIVFLHDDDILGMNYLEEIMKAFVEIGEKDIDIVWGARNLIDVSGNIFNTLVGLKSAESNFVQVKNEAFFYKMLGNNEYNYGGRVIFPMVTGLMVRKDLARQAMFDTKFRVNADGLFLWKIFFLSDNSLFINIPIVNYRWVEDSERAKPSEQGIVYKEMKGILLSMIDYMDSILDMSRMRTHKQNFMRNFYAHSIGVNSSVTWISLRYKGSYINRIKIIFGILFEVVINYPKALFKFDFYVCLVIGFMPQAVLKPLYHFYMKGI